MGWRSLLCYRDAKTGPVCASLLCQRSPRRLLPLPISSPCLHLPTYCLSLFPVLLLWDHGSLRLSEDGAEFFSWVQVQAREIYNKFALQCIRLGKPSMFGYLPSSTGPASGWMKIWWLWPSNLTLVVFAAILMGYASGIELFAPLSAANKWFSWWPPSCASVIMRFK